MEHQYHLVRISSNRKLGGIPATTTSSSSCPQRCSYRDGGGCYGESGPVYLHWKKVDEGSRSVPLDTLCEQIKMLPKFQLWRHNQVGDLPGDGITINVAQLRKLVRANTGRHGFTFTHYDPFDPKNAAAVREANERGFTVNLSAESLEEADQFKRLGVGPVVVALPVDAPRTMRTPGGFKVAGCPAVFADATCSTCAMCADPKRTAIIGFPAHGTGKAKVERVFWAKSEAAAAA